MSELVNQGANSATSHDWLTVTRENGIRITASQFSNPPYPQKPEDVHPSNGAQAVLLKQP